MFVCVCGYREKLSDFEKRREDKGAGKRDVQKFMASQDRSGGNTALAEALKKWQENAD
jgi:DNA topoisomerase-3